MCIEVLWRINAFILIIFSVNRDTNRMDFAPKFRIREFSYWFEPTRMPSSSESRRQIDKT